MLTDPKNLIKIHFDPDDPESGTLYPHPNPDRQQNLAYSSLGHVSSPKKNRRNPFIIFGDVLYTRQEAQLPLRNRASATYFFVAKLISIA